MVTAKTVGPKGDNRRPVGVIFDGLTMLGLCPVSPS